MKSLASVFLACLAFSLPEAAGTKPLPPTPASPVVGPNPANVRTTGPTKACERTLSRHLSFSGSHPDTLTIKATGPTCARAKLIVTLWTAAHRLIWKEETYLSLVERGESPKPGDPDVTFEHVIGSVENWVSYENTSSAPAWPGGAPRVTTPSPNAALQYDTKLDRHRYERIRAAGTLMLCIPIGPESAHCIAMDPIARTPVELFGRGN